MVCKNYARKKLDLCAEEIEIPAIILISYMILGMNIYSTTISRTFKSATNSSTFESATIFFQKNKYGSKCLKLPKSSRNAKKKIYGKISRTFKSTTISRTFKVRLLVAQQKFGPYLS